VTEQQQVPPQRRRPGIVAWSVVAGVGALIVAAIFYGACHKSDMERAWDAVVEINHELEGRGIVALAVPENKAGRMTLRLTISHCNRTTLRIVTQSDAIAPLVAKGGFERARCAGGGPDDEIVVP
jgi:hypothetical protein